LAEKSRGRKKREKSEKKSDPKKGKNTIFHKVVEFGCTENTTFLQNLKTPVFSYRTKTKNDTGK